MSRAGIQMGKKAFTTRLHKMVVEEVFRGECPTYDALMEQVFALEEESVCEVYDILRVAIAKVQQRTPESVPPQEVYGAFCFALFGVACE